MDATGLQGREGGLVKRLWTLESSSANNDNLPIEQNIASNQGGDVAALAIHFRKYGAGSSSMSFQLVKYFLPWDTWLEYFSCSWPHEPQRSPMVSGPPWHSEVGGAKQWRNMALRQCHQHIKPFKCWSHCQ